jgi:hypothetical protein
MKHTFRHGLLCSSVCFRWFVFVHGGVVGTLSSLANRKRRRLHEAFRLVRNQRPFHIDGVVIVPDHLEHAIRDQRDYDAHFDYSLQSGQTRLGTTRRRLAAFELPSIRTLGAGSAGMSGLAGDSGRGVGATEGVS